MIAPSSARPQPARPGARRVEPRSSGRGDAQRHRRRGPQGLRHRRHHLPRSRRILFAITSSSASGSASMRAFPRRSTMAARARSCRSRIAAMAIKAGLAQHGDLRLRPRYLVAHAFLGRSARAQRDAPDQPAPAASSAPNTAISARSPRTPSARRATCISTARRANSSARSPSPSASMRCAIPTRR